METKKKTVTLMTEMMSLKEEKCLNYQAFHLEKRVKNLQNRMITNLNLQH